jgi:hypothetical protein
LILQTVGSQEDIVFNDVGAVVYLNKEILAAIVVEQIGAHAGTLCHPIQPDASGCMMDAVMLYQDINGSMQL